MNIRLKRAKRLNPKKYFNPGVLDDKFIEGTLRKLPKKGENITFFLRDGGPLGWWMTTPVTKIIRHKTLTTYRTLNSDYQLKKGWKT